jgi:hypothetical protein
VPPVGWAHTLPWLWYPVGTEVIFLSDKAPTSQLLFRGGSLEERQVSELLFVAAVYQLDGTYLGLQLITTQLQVRQSHQLDTEAKAHQSPVTVHRSKLRRLIIVYTLSDAQECA